MAREQFVESVRSMSPGLCRGVVWQSCFARIRRTMAGYAVECGWVVPEAHNDDYDSYTDQPFPAPQPWVGRKLVFAAEDVESAVSAYDQYYTTVVKLNKIPDQGEHIGSVVR